MSAISAVPSRLSFYTAVLFASVLLPGTVVLTEVSLLGVHHVRHSGSDMAFLAGSLSRLQGAALVMFSVVGLSGGFVVGYLSRELAFWLLGWIEATLCWRADRRGAAPPQDWDRIRHMVGDEISAECVDLHPILRHLDPEVAPSATALKQVRLVGGGHQDDVRLDVLQYCKLWLRRFSPQLNVDNLEAEINMLVATVVPMVLLGVDVTVLSGPMLLRIVAVPIVLAPCAGVFQSLLRLRHTERSEALIRLVFDVAMNRAAQHTQIAPVPDEED